MQSSQAIGKQITFCDLFEKFTRVQIPIIQRDYAQGRPGQEELRNEFLGAIKDALDKAEGDPTLPLDLDFVYGSGFGSNGISEDSFAPLDGQQRLTTLFLMHWYLAWKDGQAKDFQTRFLKDQKSLFAYEVRPSSHDFFNRLAEHFPYEGPNEIPSVCALIEDKAWFFRSWNYDPTIASALTILESIHQMFRKCDDYYVLLIDSQHPRITFQLLELKNFGLSDDLYIKMNARGMPLTPFETFKARLEQHLDNLLPDETRNLHGCDVSVKEYFSHRMDTTWADLFWKHRDPINHLFDEQIMRLIKAVSLANIDPEDESALKVIVPLRSEKASISFSRYSKSGCLNKRMLQTLIELLDYWSVTGVRDDDNDNTPMYDTTAAFAGVTSRELPYPELVKFAALCRYIRIHGSTDNQNLEKWLRVIHNLVEYVDIERPSQFVDALKSLNQLERFADDIEEYLASGKVVSFFYRQQIREERIKAALILQNDSWRKLIYKAERHGYFNGQIEFLLKFSGILDHWMVHDSIEWKANEEHEAKKLFSEYLEKADTIFDQNGLRPFNDHKWERALLCHGDYTFEHGRNKSFLQNRASGGNKRPTWKLLLRGHMTNSAIEGKRELVKALFDKIDLQMGAEESLEKVINMEVPTVPWRRMMVELPSGVAYCSQRMFRMIDGGAVYLISKLRTSSEHVELWSFHLYHTLLSGMEDNGELSPFNRTYASANGEDYVPSANLSWKGKRGYAYIYFDEGKYKIQFPKKKSKALSRLYDNFEESYDIVEKEDYDTAEIKLDEIENVIRLMIATARKYEEDESQKNSRK
jgi:hypothetical protein